MIKGEITAAVPTAL